MIISDKHKYVFIELPFTASTAISKELRVNYDGRGILSKHSNYRNFLKMADPEQKTYFSFSGIRNPLDETVSRYVKLTTNPGNVFTDPEPWVTRRHLYMYRWVKERDATFPQFLRRFFHLPLETWSSLDHKRLDYVYRLENVVEEFAEILRQIGVKEVRPLPVRHRTEGKKSWESYFTPDTYRHARFVFGPKMGEWGYSFPEEWGVGPAQWHARVAYRAEAGLKNLYRRLT